MPTYVEREKRRARERGKQMNWPLVGMLIAFAFLSKIVDNALDAVSEHPWEVERAGVLWGEPVGGLRAGIECVGHGSPPADWDTPVFRLHLRNEGTEPVRVVHLGVILPLTDSEPIEVRCDDEPVAYEWGSSYTQHPPDADWFGTIEPGETVTEKDWLHLRHWGLEKNYAADVRFVYEWREPEVEASNDSRESVSVTGLWTGRVQSPPIAVTRGLPGWPGMFLRITVALGWLALMVLAGRHFRPRQAKASVPENSEAGADDASAVPPSATR
ncbi:MAG: hypothetical protein ACYTKD_20640 [Planctomycetota bacterium]|jgi:hypothetical protein